MQSGGVQALAGGASVSPFDRHTRVKQVGQSSRSGGIGRRAGFKIPSGQPGEGSSPSSGSDSNSLLNSNLRPTDESQSSGSHGSGARHASCLPIECPGPCELKVFSSRNRGTVENPLPRNDPVLFPPASANKENIITARRMGWVVCLPRRNPLVTGNCSNSVKCPTSLLPGWMRLPGLVLV